MNPRSWRTAKSRLRFVTVLPLLGWLAACTTIGSSQHEETIAITGATVVHPHRSGELVTVPHSTIVIVGDRIRAIGPMATTPVPPNAVHIDGSGKWVTPGLIDSHVHFFQSGNLYTRPDVADLTKWVPYEREVMRNKERLFTTFRIWLASGVTSVVDIGGPMWNFKVREMARNNTGAPRVATAGPLVSMIDRLQLDLGDPPIIKVTSAQAARELVRGQLEHKPDFIKVWFIHRPGDDLATQEAMVKAAGDAAHAAGVRLAVHATELAVAKAALRAGADFLVHSVTDQLVDEEFLLLAKKNRVLYCPTLFVSLGYQYALSGTWQPTVAETRIADPHILAAMQDLNKYPVSELPVRVQGLLTRKEEPRVSPIAIENLRKVWNAGIPVVMGTDAGNIGTLHGPSVFREMELMLLAGLSPLDVLRSATTNGALSMGREKDLGKIETGMLADMLILDADPLADVQNLSRIHLLIKGGRLYDPEVLRTAIHRTR